MHARRLACFILGMWLAAGIAVAWLEREDFQTIQDVLSQPDPAVAERIKALGAHETYLLMGHVASEQRQRTIRSWEDLQLLLGLGFFFFLLFGTREGKLPLAMALLLVGIVLLERFLLTPEALSLARIASFAAGASSGEAVRRMVLSSAHEGFEIAKWMVEATLAAVLVLRRNQRLSDSGDQLDVVDKSDYGHVNR
ncbi:MAG TPA: hypothetical protein VGE89_06400 [Bryobacteraceae bacterium]